MIILLGCFCCLLIGCGGSRTTTPVPPPEIRSPLPGILNFGVLIQRDSQKSFLPFIDPRGVETTPSVPIKSQVAFRASITNDTDAQPIREVWISSPELPDQKVPLFFEVSDDPLMAPFTYTTSLMPVPFSTPGEHILILHVTDAGGDTATRSFRIKVVQ